MHETNLHHRLLQLLGGRFQYLGHLWILIEVLADSDSVVLRRCSPRPDRTVQRNAYGVPNRRVEDTLTLRISDNEGGYSQDLLVLLEGHQADSGSNSGPG